MDANTSFGKYNRTATVANISILFLQDMPADSEVTHLRNT